MWGLGGTTSFTACLMGGLRESLKPNNFTIYEGPLKALSGVGNPKRNVDFH